MRKHADADATRRCTERVLRAALPWPSEGLTASTGTGRVEEQALAYAAEEGLAHWPPLLDADDEAAGIPLGDFVEHCVDGIPVIGAEAVDDGDRHSRS